MPVIETKVCKNGNSAAVTLPADWRKKAHVEIGDTVTIHYEYDGMLYIEAKKRGTKAKARILDELVRNIEKAPSVPWENDTPEADRSLLEERYA